MDTKAPKTKPALDPAEAIAKYQEGIKQAAEFEGFTCCACGQTGIQDPDHIFGDFTCHACIKKKSKVDIQCVKCNSIFSGVPGFNSYCPKCEAERAIAIEKAKKPTAWVIGIGVKSSMNATQIDDICDKAFKTELDAYKWLIDHSFVKYSGKTFRYISGTTLFATKPTEEHV
jgi:hypothetical protein